FKTTFDADSARISNLEVCVIPPRQEEPLRPHKVLTVEPSVYLQRLSELSWPARQLPHIVLSSIPLHLLNPLEWLEGPDEDRTPDSLPLSLHVQAVVETVRKIDIRLSGLA